MPHSNSPKFGGVSSDNASRFGALKPGIVTQVNEVEHKIKVRWLDQEEIESFWLPVLKMWTGPNRHYALPDVGEQVICLMDYLQEDGIVLGSIYSDEDPTPVQNIDKTHLQWKDRTYMEYDRDTHEAKVIILEEDGNIFLQAGDAIAYLTGKRGPLARFVAGNDVVAQTNIIIPGIDEEVITSIVSVSLMNHIHSGVTPGTGTTGPPVPGLPEVIPPQWIPPPRELDPDQYPGTPGGGNPGGGTGGNPGGGIGGQVAWGAVVFGEDPPVGAPEGSRWADTVNGVEYIRQNGQWVQYE